MKFFIDTANIEHIRQAKRYGMLDGVTTNPTLMAKEGKDWKPIAEQICKEVEGPVSLEVVGTKADEMIKEAKELVKFGPNVVVKIPIIPEGLIALRELTAMGIDTNTTLIFSPLQALMAMKAGASYISPFIGRLDGIGHDGMELVEELLTIRDNYDFETEVLVASIRHPHHVMQAALLGADIATIPYSVIFDLIKHPLTDKGLEQFLADWKKQFGE